MLKVGRPSLFIEIGMLKKKNKKRMGENPKKKEIWIRVSWFFRLEPVSYFDHIAFVKIQIKLKFCQLKENSILYNFSRNSLVINLSYTMPKVPQNVNLSTFLRCFPTLRLYLDKFQNYFHDKPHSKVIIMTF